LVDHATLDTADIDRFADVARAALRQGVLEEDVAEDVENGLAAPS
jgi:hypothetical protein